MENWKNSLITKKINAQFQSVLINLFSCFGLITVDLLVVLKDLKGSMRDATCEHHKPLQTILVWWFQTCFRRSPLLGGGFK